MKVSDVNDGQCQQSTTFTKDTVVILQNLSSEYENLSGRRFKIISFDGSKGKYKVEDIENNMQCFVPLGMLKLYSPSETKDDGYCAVRGILTNLKMIGAEVK